jgi:RecB family exonuclease
MFAGKHWEIDDGQSQQLALAMSDVIKLHKLDVLVSPKTMAYVKLAGVGAAVYGPKLMISFAMLRQRRLQKKQAEAVGFTGGQPVNGATAEPADPTAPPMGVYKYQ